MVNTISCFGKLKKNIMKKYIVTETESNAPNYKYQEDFDTIEAARTRMLDLYRQVVIEGNLDAIEKAELYQNSAIVYLIDGSTVEWEVYETNE